MEIENEVNQFIEKYPEEWLISAIVDNSVGYYAPDTAKRLIKDWKKGRRECCSERCMALYGCNLGKMLLSDFRHFEILEQYGNTQPIIERVKAWLGLPPDAVRDMELSLMYPVL